jgi:hypothetical protein
VADGTQDSRTSALRLFAALALVYAFYAQEGYGANANRYVALAHAIVLEGRIEVTTWRETTNDTAWVDGRWYAGAAPGPAIVMLPFYVGFRALYPLVPASVTGAVERAARGRIEARTGGAPSGFDLAEFVLSVQALTLIVAPLAGAALGVVLLVWFRRRLDSTRDALLLALAASLGTIVFHYSTVLFSHVLAALCAFSAFALLDPRGPRAGAGRAALAGSLAGAAPTMDYLAAFAAAIVGALALASLRPARERLAFALGAAVPLALLAAYHAAAFGSPLLTPYAFPAGPEGAGTHQVVTGGAYGLGLPSARVLAEIAFGPRRGYFLHQPILLAGLLGLGLALRRAARAAPGAPEDADRAGLLAASAIVVAFFLLNASMQAEYYWLGATSFGPRYLIPSIPFAAAGLPFAWSLGRRSRIAVLALGGISVFVNWLGAQIGASDQLTAFPLVDRFLPAFLAGGPQSTLLGNLASLTSIDPTLLVALNWLALALLAAAITRILGTVFRS